MNTREMLAKAIKRHPELEPFHMNNWPEGLQEQIQQKIKQPRRNQGVSTHTCAPYVAQCLVYFWVFVKEELHFGEQNRLPDNSMSMTQLWLRYLMYRNYNEKWNDKQADWKEVIE